MKSDQTIIRKNHMEQLHFITKLLDIKDPNIKILDIINRDSHKEIIAKLDYEAPSCPDCGNQMKKYDFQKPSKIPYLETTGMPTRILLRKRRFKCYHCSKMMVAETSLVKKNHQIPRIINQKIAQKLIEKTSMTDIAHQLGISTSTVIRDHFLKYDRTVRCRVKIITMDMFNPYYDLAKQLRFRISRLKLKRSPRLFHSHMLKSFLIAFTLRYSISKLRLKQSHWTVLLQHLSRPMIRFRVQIMNQFERKSHEYKAIKRYWKLIQQDSRKLSDKRFYRPTFRMHLTNKEILDKILSYSEDLKHHYQLSALAFSPSK